MAPILKLVVPTFNSEAFLPECLESIVSQRFDGLCNVHCQDGGSSDGTLELLEEWSSKFEPMTRFAFTYASEPDAGIYDALERGFASLGIDDDCIMTWIGSDDIFLPGAFATVLYLFSALPAVHWITGRRRTFQENGVWNSELNPEPDFTSFSLGCGHHDGRTLAFVQQEGTFWRGQLWNKVGGLDVSLRLAGDWDLWRRFSHHSQLYIFDGSPLAAFRKRKNQSSEDMAGYYREVDERLCKPDSQSKTHELLSSDDQTLFNKYYARILGRARTAVQRNISFVALADNCSSVGAILEQRGSVPSLSLQDGVNRLRLRIKRGSYRLRFVISKAHGRRITVSGVIGTIVSQQWTSDRNQLRYLTVQLEATCDNPFLCINVENEKTQTGSKPIERVGVISIDKLVFVRYDSKQLIFSDSDGDRLLEMPSHYFRLWIATKLVSFLQITRRFIYAGGRKILALR